MRGPAICCAVVLSLAGGGLAGCGGHGHGYGLPASPVTITSTALPATQSGEQVHYCIPFTGGAGGPFLLDVIDGALPAGIALDSTTVCLTGRALVDGTFDFTLRLTDTGSTPFTVSIKSFHWVIAIGTLVFATDPVLAPIAFNQFVSIPLVVAGGVPPYACEVIDDPANPIDEPAPLGMIIPTDSCTFVGAPIGVKPGTAPFVYKVSVRAHDHADNPAFPTPSTVIREFTLTVLIPPVVITTVAVGNGKCGTAYNDQIGTAEGIPPFRFTLSDVSGSFVVLRGPAPSLNPVAKGLPGSAYAPDATAGPYPGKFPEGVNIVDLSGLISGTPRRAGSFPSFTIHVQSTALPLVANQNAWKTYGFTMADANPPAVALNNSVLLAGNTFSTANNFLQDADAGKPYSKQFLATGGVPMDGFSDAPNTSDRVNDLSETAGQLIWTSSISGVPSLATLGMTFTAGGVLRGTGPSNAVGSVRSGFVTLTVTAADVQLPQPPLTAPHFSSGTCQFSVGPDLAIITESTAAATIQNVEGNFAPINTFNHVSYEYNDQSVYAFEPSSTLSVRGLANTDLTATHSALPAALTASGGTGILEKLDHQPITVNPTWWAYDMYNLNASGARGLQHADPQHLNGSDGYNADSFESYGNSVYYIAFQNGATSFDTKERNGDACIELPPAPTVTHDPIGTGVYNNGGQLRAFDGGTYLGFYIVRKDSKLYLPWVINKASAGIQGFGDSVQNSNRAVSSVYRRLQISVSPDGRFAAAKLKPSVNNFDETCGSEQIVIFSLTGEKAFGGATFRTMTTGGAGNTNDGQFFYGDSMTLTNDNLYFLKGNNIGTSSDAVIYSEHWVYKVAILSGTPALLSPGFGGVGGWTNATGQPLSTTYHRWAPPGCTSLDAPWNGSWAPSPGASYLTTGNPSYAAADVMAYNWGNFTELSSAPMPFRVSKNGKAVAIVAADGTNFGNRADEVGTSNFFSRSIYVDFQGGSFQEAAPTRRRFAGGTRLAGQHIGEWIYKLYAWYEGPATQLEISDDGTVIADVYNADTDPWINDGPSNTYVSNPREDLSILRATGASGSDPWTSASEAIATTNFVNNIWRFGCLALTRNATSNSGGSAGAAIFWGGASMNNAMSASPTDLQTNVMAGTLYQYTISSGTTESILAYNQGGHISGVFGITGGSPNSTVPNPWGNEVGSIMPAGYFISNDGRFLYMESLDPLVDSGQASGAPINGGATTTGRLVAVPVFDTSTTINSKSPLRAFALGGWPLDPNGHGFGQYGAGQQSNNDWMQMFQWCGGVGNRKFQTAVTAAGGSGTVFFNGYLQDNAWSSTNDYSSGFNGGGPTNNVAWSDGSQFAGEVYAFNSNVGGSVVNLTNFGGTANSTMRSITYMQPNNAGTKVAFQTTSSNTVSFAHRMSNQEQIYAVTNVNFSATGALTTVPTRLSIESTNGRAGPSMAWDSTDTRLYYAFIAGGANENNMQLREATINQAGTIVTGYRTQPTGFAGTAARFAILNSAR